MRRAVLAAVVYFFTGSLTLAGSGHQPQAGLRDAYPSVQFFTLEASPARIWGTEFGQGLTPEDTAAQFVERYAGVFGVTPEELMPGNPFNDATTQGVMYDPESGDYRFTLVYYRQVKDELPVFRSDLRLLVRNDPGFPLVWAGAHLTPVGELLVPAGALAEPAVAAARAAVVQRYPLMLNFSPAETVVWPDRDSKPRVPRVALAFVADNGEPGTPYFDKRLIVADAATGEIVHDESMILSAVSGQVLGRATENLTADACAAESPTPLPYVRVQLGGEITYADENGFYTIDGIGTTITAGMVGRYFYVDNRAGSELTISLSANPPDVIDFDFNAVPSEFGTAQINGYVQANNVRDMVLASNPSYPTISTQLNWPVNVNLNDTCNAYYDYSSINFFRSGGGCNNTAFGDVVHHEYGHHLAHTGGSGQGEYGEGLGDCMGVLLTLRSQLGVGFKTCASGIRNADNNFQYPCSGEIHYCGQLLSGCVWDLLQELQLVAPADYLQVARDLTVNSILLHAGDSITPAITTDFLTLDDGTHTTAIENAFGAHNMIPLPPPVNDDIEDAIAACPGTYTGSTTWATNDGSSSCASSSSSPDVWYKYTPETNGTLVASMCDGTTYDAAMSIHTGIPANVANEVACNDDACGVGGPPRITIGVTAGTTYYIRVTGWSSSAGPFALSISGPECVPDAALRLRFPAGLPTVVAPGAATPIDVAIDDLAEVYVPGTAELHYRFDGGAFVGVPLSAAGDVHQALLPATDCGSKPEFYFSAQGDGGSIVTSPDDAPATLYSAAVGTQVMLFEDGFASDQGWTTLNLGATAGDWQRGQPVNDPAWSYDPQSDSDGDGWAYLTGNVLGNSDVDDGAVQLVSPLIDMTSGDVTIAYDYFLRLTNADGAIDRLLVEISSNGAAGPWTEIARHTLDGGLYWYPHEIPQATLDREGVTLTSTMQVRFTVNDDEPQSIVEAGVDAFRVYSFSCETAPTACQGDFDCNGARDFFDIDYLLAALGGEAAWAQKYRSDHGGEDPPCAFGDVGDPDGQGDGTTFFDIDPFLDVLGTDCP